MRILLFGFVALIAAFVVQVAVVRVLQPRNHAAVIVVVFGIFSALALVAFALFSPAEGSGWGHWIDLGRLALLLGSLSLAYIAVYSAIEDDSPSMAMVKMAWQAGHKGCAESDFRAVMDDQLFLDQRLEAMKRDGWIGELAGEVFLTPLGRFWASLFYRAQVILRMDEGG